LRARSPSPFSNLPYTLPDEKISLSLQGAGDAHPHAALERPRVARRFLRKARRADRPAIIEQLAARVRQGETVTLLCSAACVDEEQCHRTLLKELIERAVSR
jgi:hypothetical protein